MFSILILEDEIISRANLVKTLKNLGDNILIMEAATGKEAIEIAQTKHIDLFFLDIGIEDMSGIKVAETIRKMKKYTMSYIVFITTHIEHMLLAFKQLHCYDFLEKPFRMEEVISLTKLIIDNMLPREKRDIAYERHSITIKLKHCILRVYTDDILFIEVMGRTCMIHTKNKKLDISYVSLKKIKNLLLGQNFIQSHKSFVVNTKHIESIQKQTEILSEIYFSNYSQPALCSKKFLNILIEKMEGKLGVYER